MAPENYKEIKEKLGKVEKELAQIKEYCDKTLSYKDNSEYMVSLMMARKALESICKQVYINEISPDIKDVRLATMIKKLEEKNIFPPTVLPHLRTVQNFGNFSAHDNEDGLNDINDSFIEPALISLSYVTQWYFETYQGQSEFESSLKRYINSKSNHIENFNTPLPEESLEDDLQIENGEIPVSKFVLIVVGSNFWSEVNDRKIAKILAGKIQKYTESEIKTIILSDKLWLEDSKLQNNPSISIGHPSNNLLTEKLIQGGTNNWSIEGLCGTFSMNSVPKAALWAEDMNKTLFSVYRYISRPEGLKAFLSFVLQIPANKY